MDMGMALGDVPTKYFTKSVFSAEKVSGQALRQAYAVENYACHGCPIGCGRVIKNFRPDLESIDGPEYETTAAFGPLCMNQEGIGKIIAKGTLAMAREFNRDEGEAAQVKGLEVSMHDGRAFHGLAISYATGPRGACHLKGDYYNVDLGAFVAEWNILPGNRMGTGFRRYALNPSPTAMRQVRYRI